MNLFPLADYIFSVYHRYRLADITPLNCTHAVITAALDRVIERSSGALKCSLAGQSIEGRAVAQVEFGHGPKRILLWTQMHGDESTATLAVLDLLNVIVAECGSAWLEALRSQITVRCIPMLNPDGAERFQRQNAAQIDLNRDARILATPEARILRDQHHAFGPEFAFNLHDQPLSSAGDTLRPAALSLVAPPADEKRSINHTRLRAMRVGAFICQALSPYVYGSLTRYGDEYECRAFGDTMQAWKTSTLLIESGHWPSDPEKAFVRKLNVVALLSAFSAIGDGSFLGVTLDPYFDLPPNGKRLFAIMLSNVALVHHSGQMYSVQVGLDYVPRRDSTGLVWPEKVVVKEVGDLHMYGGLRSIDACKRQYSSDFFAVERSIPVAELSDVLGMDPEQR
jgi:hypothetical protein